MGEEKLERVGIIENPKGQGYVVNLYVKGEPQFGQIQIQDKSIYYAEDVKENWENGILTPNNEYIVKDTTAWL